MRVTVPGAKDRAVKKVNMGLSFPWEGNKNRKRKGQEGSSDQCYTENTG